MSLVPTIFDLPMMEFGGAPIYLFADLPEGARVSWTAVGKLEVLHSNVLPAAVMLVLIGPDHAGAFRPLKIRKAPNPLELGEAPMVSIGPVEIPVLVDVVHDLEATITQGMLVGGGRLPVPVVPARSLVCVIPPELAMRLRPIIHQALREAAKAQQRQGAGGLTLH